MVAELLHSTYTQQQIVGRADKYAGAASSSIARIGTYPCEKNAQKARRESMQGRIKPPRNGTVVSQQVDLVLQVLGAETHRGGLGGITTLSEVSNEKVYYSRPTS